LLLLLVRREDVLRKIGKRLLLKRPPAVGSSVPVPVDREKSTEALWKEFSSRLRAFIARRIGNPADAEDILQEVFVRVHRKIGTLNEADKTAPWLFRIARNVVIDHYRSCAARHRRDDAPAEGTAWASPRDVEAHRELSACLEPMVACLPGPYRSAIRLVDQRGLAQAEAARRERVSLSGMKSRVQRGRDRLKKLLADCCRLTFAANGDVMDFEPKAGCSCPPGGRSN
jgi:RNA polymerase sigma-70 factor, ECF subfamily